MHDLLQRHLSYDDHVLESRWSRLQEWVERRFEQESSIEAVLFLIGIQSRGRGYEPEMEKELKQDTIMEGTYCAFEKLGFYERIGLDENGFWIWERTVDEIPKLELDQQEKLLKLGIVRVFEEVLGTASDASGGSSTSGS